MSGFKVGDTVNINPCCRYHGENEDYNPHHSVAGLVVKVYKSGTTRVRWPSYCTNVYEPEELEHYQEFEGNI